MKTAIEIQHPEYIGLMFLHAARWHLQKALAGPYSKDAVRKLRPILPYQMVCEEGEHIGIRNRGYKPMGVTTEGYAPNLDRYYQHRVPSDKCRATSGAGEMWFFDDGCLPWHGRHYAEIYLEFLEGMFDFSLDGLPELPDGQEVPE